MELLPFTNKNEEATIWQEVEIMGLGAILGRKEI
jgi:hypothetical protein